MCTLFSLRGPAQCATPDCIATAYRSRKKETCNSDWNKQLEEYVRTAPPCYSEHPVVKSCWPAQCVPLAVYFDGVQYQKKDSCIGFFLVNLVTERRHLVCELRKGHMCRCGCGGWCSLRPIYCFLNWAFTSLAAGEHATQHHNGITFRATETSLIAKAGSGCVRGALIFLKADLAEFGATLGFPTTATHKNRVCCAIASITTWFLWKAGMQSRAPIEIHMG